MKAGKFASRGASACEVLDVVICSDGDFLELAGYINADVGDIIADRKLAIGVFVGGFESVFEGLEVGDEVAAGGDSRFFLVGDACRCGDVGVGGVEGCGGKT